MNTLVVLASISVALNVLLLFGFGTIIGLLWWNAKQVKEIIDRGDQLDRIEGHVAGLTEEINMDSMNMLGDVPIIEVGSFQELMEKMQQKNVNLTDSESENLKAFFENLLNQQNDGLSDDDEDDKPWKKKK
jgi:hypothetical protein